MRWSGPDAAFKPQIVCDKRCNSGWMSKLETRVIPFLSRMIKGDPITLTLADQTDIALWSVKTAIVFDAAWTAGPHYFTQDERERLQRALCGTFENPFPNCLVWLAVYRGLESCTFLGMVADGLVRSADQQQSLPSYIATISAGRFVTQLFFMRTREEHQKAEIVLHPKKEFARFTHEVHPPHLPYVSWPPGDVLGDSANSLEDFAKRWPHGPING